MTSSTKEVLAITTLDGQPVGQWAKVQASPARSAQQMWQWYQDFRENARNAQRLTWRDTRTPCSKFPCAFPAQDHGQGQRWRWPRPC
jgi:hypothetical protein